MRFYAVICNRVAGVKGDIQDTYVVKAKSAQAAIERITGGAPMDSEKIEAIELRMEGSGYEIVPDGTVDALIDLCKRVAPSVWPRHE